MGGLEQKPLGSSRARFRDFPASFARVFLEKVVACLRYTHVCLHAYLVLLALPCLTLTDMLPCLRLLH